MSKLLEKMIGKIDEKMHFLAIETEAFSKEAMRLVDEMDTIGVVDLYKANDALYLADKVSENAKKSTKLLLKKKILYTVFYRSFDSDTQKDV